MPPPLPEPFDTTLLTPPPADVGGGFVQLTYSEVLAPYVYIFYAAYVVAFLFTPIMRRVAAYFDIVDKPDGVRKVHEVSVAYLGGVAVFLGFAVGLVVARFSGYHGTVPGLPATITIPPGLVLGAVTVVILGLWDDCFGVRARWKVLGQVLSAVVLLVDGIGTTITEPFVTNVNARLLAYTPVVMTPEVVGWVTLVTSAVLVVAIIVFCSNASNLMDGLDGLCGGVTAIIAFGFVALAAAAAVGVEGTVDGMQADALRLVVSLALLGAVLGFVPFNFNPASIFMGDTGSLFLGFTCGLMLILLGEAQAKWLLAGSVMFALPVLDTGLAFARRKIAGRPLFSADKHHFHHQLVARGLSVKQAVLVAYGLAIFFVLCGVAIVFVRTRFALGFYLVLFGSIVVAAYKIGMIHERKPPKKVAKQIATGDLAAAERPEVGDKDNRTGPEGAKIRSQELAEASA